MGHWIILALDKDVPHGNVEDVLDAGGASDAADVVVPEAGRSADGQIHFDRVHEAHQVGERLAALCLGPSHRLDLTNSRLFFNLQHIIKFSSILFSFLLFANDYDQG